IVRCATAGLAGPKVSQVGRCVRTDFLVGTEVVSQVDRGVTAGRPGGAEVSKVDRCVTACRSRGVSGRPVCQSRLGGDRGFSSRPMCDSRPGGAEVSQVDRCVTAGLWGPRCL
ncbi:hypothetical protein GWI33_010101, partial [Rhynchophorus ferrugineus]